jgi:hypothetical protein
LVSSYKCFDGWALGSDKFGESSGEREGKFGKVPVPPQSTPKDKFASKPNQPREKLSEEKSSEKPSEEKPVGKPSGEKPSEQPQPKPKSKLVRFHCGYCGEMAIRMSFAIREGERREWLRSGQTMIGTTLLVVCLSLVCLCPRERVLCIRFQHGEMVEPQVEVSLLAEDHRPYRSE